MASVRTGPHPPASHLAHFSGALPAPTFRPAEPRAPLSLPPGGQSSWRGGVRGAGSSGSRSLGLRPRFLPPARPFSPFWGAEESWLRCLGGGSAEVRNQFWGEDSSNEDPRPPATALRRLMARGCAHAPGRPESQGPVPGDNASPLGGGCPLRQPPCPALILSGGPVSSCPIPPPEAAHLADCAGATWRPSPPTSAWALRMWYLTPLSELNSLAHSKQQYFPTRWSPCKTGAQPPRVGQETDGSRDRRPGRGSQPSVESPSPEPTAAGPLVPTPARNPGWQDS